MTQDVALLPLPALEPELEALHPGLKGFIYMYARDYARACVEANVGQLRAEGAYWKGQHLIQAREATVAEAHAERLEEALREAREYVASELAEERAKFAGYERCSSIASIEADLARIDAALTPNAAQPGETT